MKLPREGAEVGGAFPEEAGASRDLLIGLRAAQGDEKDCPRKGSHGS
ncbi:MAG: hypothetical protein ABSA41_14625 [Terriglobia bacterium]|jgi:hypothetical protein